MRIKITMINDLGGFYEETFITNNETEAKMNVKLFNPNSMLVDAKRVYK